MTDLASTDVTITLKPQDIGQAMGRYWTFPTIAFGNGALTYPTNGVPLPVKGALGPFKKEIQRFIIEGPPATGYVYKYDRVNHTIRIYQGNGGDISGATFAGDALATHTHDIKLIGGITATEPVAVQGGDTLGKNAATDRTIAGADSATKGGVVAVSAGTPSGDVTGTVTIVAGPLSELGNVAVAATTLYVTVIGK